MTLGRFPLSIFYSRGTPPRDPVDVMNENPTNPVSFNDRMSVSTTQTVLQVCLKVEVVTNGTQLILNRG